MENICEPIDNDNHFVEIVFKYDKGGNYLTEQRGYYIYFTKVKIEEGFKVFMPKEDTNFKLLIKPVNRYSLKMYNNLSDSIYAMKDKLIELFINNDKDAIYCLLKGLNDGK